MAHHNHFDNSTFIQFIKATQPSQLPPIQASIHTWKPREVDYWIVLPQLGQTQQMGKPIRLNRTIRLQHITTRAHLHTHSTNSASSTGLGGLPEYEISLLPDIRSDSNDVWIVEVFNFSRKPTASGGDADVEDISPALNHDTLESADFWHVDNVVAFRHKVTGHRLAGRATQPLDKEAGLAKVVAAKRCEIESAWRVVVPKEDEDVIQMSASMEEVNTLDRFTVEQVGEMESSLINVEMIK
ncbi:hypothetical protein BC938DRAFT_479625 [Jimgerdemannia flammicorona]|uniref:MIR domain-containing protein n=1 Tax=Jimgerdemannia flammicorona TaxID=994334 RepID=A0A433QXS3_9FUNG|nr:hypothetical protein BC938DRAFT_479625 [Jimgerdemannia flammicorona]